MDLMSDQLFGGRHFRVLTIVDNYTNVSPAIGVEQSYQGSDVVETLETVVDQYGRPAQIYVDSGPEFISRHLDLWAYVKGVEMDFPGLESQRMMPSLRHSIASFDRSV